MNKKAGHIIVIRRSGGDGRALPVFQDCLFGRSTECDVRIQLPNVDHVHCHLYVAKDKQVHAINTSSSNKTLINGSPMAYEENRLLQNMDILSIADRKFRWEYEAKSESRTSSAGKRKSGHKFETPLSKRKSVSFGPYLSPEHFDKQMPPSTPVKHGDSPYIDLESMRKGLLIRRSPTPIKPRIAKALGLSPKSLSKTPKSKLAEFKDRGKTPNKTWAKTLKKGLMVQGVPDTMDDKKKVMVKTKKKRKVIESDDFPVMESYGIGTTGHINSPAPIIIRKKMLQTPKKFKKGRKSKTALRDDHDNSLDLEGVGLLFNSPSADKPCKKLSLTPHSKSSNVKIRSPNLPSYPVKKKGSSRSSFSPKRKSTPRVSRKSIATEQSETVLNISVSSDSSSLSTTANDSSVESRACNVKSLRRSKNSAKLNASQSYCPISDKSKCLTEPRKKRNKRNITKCKSLSPDILRSRKHQKALSLDSSEISFTESEYEQFEDYCTPDVTEENFVSPLGTPAISSNAKASSFVKQNFRKEIMNVSVDADFTNFDFGTVESPNITQESTVSPLKLPSETNMTSNAEMQQNNKKRFGKRPLSDVGVGRDFGNNIEHKRRRKSTHIGQSTLPLLKENKNPFVESSYKEAISPTQKNINSLNSAIVRSSKKLRSLQKSASPIIDSSSDKHDLLKNAKQISGNINDYSDVEGNETLMMSLNEQSPIAIDKDLQNLVETTARNRQSHSTDYTNVTGVKKLLGTPKQSQSPMPDYTDVKGVKKLLKTPKTKQQSPISDYTDVKGVKKLLKTPKSKEQLPISDYTDVRGVKKLLGTPKPKPKSPIPDYTDVKGVKKLLKTPKIKQQSPISDYTDVKGVKKLLNTPKYKEKSIIPDYNDVRGVKKLLGTPKPKPQSPIPDYTNVNGIKKLLKTPKPNQQSPIPDYTDVKGLKRLLRDSSSPISDYTDVKGVKRLMRGRTSPMANYTNVEGLADLMKSPEASSNLSGTDLIAETPIQNTPVKHKRKPRKPAISPAKDIDSPRMLRRRKVIPNNAPGSSDNSSNAKKKTVRGGVDTTKSNHKEDSEKNEMDIVDTVIQSSPDISTNVKRGRRIKNSVKTSTEGTNNNKESVEDDIQTYVAPRTRGRKPQIVRENSPGNLKNDEGKKKVQKSAANAKESPAVKLEVMPTSKTRRNNRQIKDTDSSVENATEEKDMSVAKGKTRKAKIASTASEPVRQTRRKRNCSETAESEIKELAKKPKKMQKAEVSPVPQRVTRSLRSRK